MTEISELNFTFAIFYAISLSELLSCNCFELRPLPVSYDFAVYNYAPLTVSNIKKTLSANDKKAYNTTIVKQ